MHQLLQFVRQMTGRFHSDAYASISDPKQLAYIRDLHREIKKRDVLHIPFDELRVVVFDIETTGFYPYKGDRILTIGAVKMKGDHILNENTFYSAIYSDRGPSEEIEKLTGITKEQLVVAPPIRDVLQRFYQFVGSDALVAHHSSHEKQFMKHANWLALRTAFHHRILDTSFLTEVTHPGLGLHTLDEYCDYYGIINQQRHHALHDAIATAKLWSESIRQVKQFGYTHLKDVYTQLAKMK